MRLQKNSSTEVGEDQGVSQQKRGNSKLKLTRRPATHQPCREPLWSVQLVDRGRRGLPRLQGEAFVELEQLDGLGNLLEDLVV